MFQTRAHLENYLSAVTSFRTSPTSTISTVGASASTTTGSFPSTSDTNLVIDGENGHFAATNSYWLPFLMKMPLSAWQWVICSSQASRFHGFGGSTMSIPYPAPAPSGFSFSQTVSRQTAHGQACKNAGKPCLLEEYDPTSLCSSEASWQTTAISSVAADLLWQWGDALSTGESAHDEYSIFYGSSDYTCLVTDHVSAINSS